MSINHHDEVLISCFISSWEPFCHLLHLPRKYSCVEVTGARITVRGGITSEDWPCQVSQEVFDLNDPSAGWKISLIDQLDSSFCEAFICHDAVVVEKPCFG